MENQAYESALSDYSEAIALALADAESHAGRAAAAAFLGRDTEADMDADRAVELGFNRYPDGGDADRGPAGQKLTTPRLRVPFGIS